jgi:5-methylcytosine-specific restriction endonuclease McrA
VSNHGCLALNASYEPLTVTPLHRAINLVLAGKAEIVEHDNKEIRSGRLCVPYPVVIRLNRFVHVPRRFRRHVTNTFLFSRDRRNCSYCGRNVTEFRHREFLTRDHVVPLSRGGENSWENSVTACSTCNNRKADRTPTEAGMVLRITPTEPHMVHLVWAVRRLTPLQRKYVVQFFGEHMAEFLDDGR